MTANRSLDEFAGAGGGAAEPADESDDGVAGGTTAGGADETAPPAADAPDGDPREEPVPDAEAASDDVAPAVSTYAWSPDGGPCAACGEHVEERWRDGEDLVCVACKDW